MTDRPLPKIVSSDDHVIEPADVWTTRLPTKYADIGPRVKRQRGKVTFVDGVMDFIETDDGGWADVWYYEDMVQPMVRGTTFAGHDPEEMLDEQIGVTYDDMRKGCWDRDARLADMDVIGVEKSLCFPDLFAKFCGQRFMLAKDRELGLLCVKAYNDWMVEEWCGPSGGRLIPLCIAPMWDAQLAADEVRRNAARGVRAVTFSELPVNLGLASIHSGYWDPFFATCEETRTAVNIHIGSGSKMLTTSPDAPSATVKALVHLNAEMSLVDWLVSGLFERYPNLIVSMGECQIGWIPYALERLDGLYSKFSGMRDFHGRLKRPPSSYFRSNMYVSFFDDEHGLRSIQEIGVDNVTFESDFPHSDGTWPDTSEVVRRLFAEVDDVTMEKLLRTNALRMLGMAD